MMSTVQQLVLLFVMIWFNFNQILAGVMKIVSAVC